MYFDNFFTGLPLQHVGGTGTVRENRLENCKMPNSKDMKKKQRGKLPHTASNKIVVAKWHDNSIDTIASTCHGVDPITKVDRIGFVHKKGLKFKSIAQQLSFIKYMDKIHRVDRFDVNSMRIGLRGRKYHHFCFPHFAFGIDAGCQNAWLIKRQSELNWTYCNFPRGVVTTYLQKYGKPPTRNSAYGVPVQMRVLEVRTTIQKSIAHSVETDIVTNALEKCALSAMSVCI